MQSFVQGKINYPADFL